MIWFNESLFFCWQKKNDGGACFGFPNISLMGPGPQQTIAGGPLTNTHIVSRWTVEWTTQILKPSSAKKVLET